MDYEMEEENKTDNVLDDTLTTSNSLEKLEIPDSLISQVKFSF